MLVVGAHLLSAFWDRHPRAEAPLRALHALLARAPAGDPLAMLAGAEREPDGRLSVRLEGVRVRLHVGASGVARVESVEEAR